MKFTLLQLLALCVLSAGLGRAGETTGPGDNTKAAAPDGEALPAEIADPFNEPVQGGGTSRSVAVAAKATQGLRVLGIAKSSTGEAEVILSIPNQPTLYVRSGEQFTVAAGGSAAVCEVKSVGDQEVTLFVNGQVEIRLR